MKMYLFLVLSLNKIFKDFYHLLITNLYRLCEVKYGGAKFWQKLCQHSKAY